MKEIMEFLYCNGILYINIVQMFTKKITLHFLFAVWYCKYFRLMVLITEGIYKRVTDTGTQKKFKKI